MKDFYHLELDKQRKQKQEFLRQNVIEDDYDPDEFFEFINKEKKDGANVDNWSLDELETIVLIFKKQAYRKPDKDILKHKLEEVEIEFDNDVLYAV